MSIHDDHMAGREASWEHVYRAEDLAEQAMMRNEERHERIENELRQQLAASQERERVLREALAWYADVENYMPRGERLHSAMLNDGGSRALEALKETEARP